MYGEKPTKLDVRFAYDYIDDIFPQFYKLYGASAGLKAYSDGVDLWTKGDKPGDWIKSKAPSKEELEKQGFRSTATLVFVLPKVSLAGAYHINTRSFHSIVKLNSSIDYIKHLFGRIQGLPLQLILEGKEAHITINGKPAKKTVYTMRLHFEEAEIMAFMQKRKVALAKMQEEPVSLEAPKMELPPPADEVDEDEESEFEQELNQEAAGNAIVDGNGKVVGEQEPADDASEGAAAFDNALKAPPEQKPLTPGMQKAKQAMDKTLQH